MRERKNRQRCGKTQRWLDLSMLLSCCGDSKKKYISCLIKLKCSFIRPSGRRDEKSRQRSSIIAARSLYLYINFVCALLKWFKLISVVSTMQALCALFVEPFYGDILLTKCSLHGSPLIRSKVFQSNSHCSFFMCCYLFARKVLVTIEQFIIESKKKKLLSFDN